jgi:hypothetical protein
MAPVLFCIVTCILRVAIPTPINKSAFCASASILKFFIWVSVVIVLLLVF